MAEKPVIDGMSARTLHRSVSSQLGFLRILARIIVCGVGLLVFGRRVLRRYVFERCLVLAALCCLL
jgi:hypothetical protein